MSLRALAQIWEVERRAVYYDGGPQVRTSVAVRCVTPPLSAESPAMTASQPEQLLGR